MLEVIKIFENIEHLLEKIIQKLVKLLVRVLWIMG